MTTPPPARPPPTANVLAFVMGKASSILIVQAPTPPLSPLCVTCTFRLEAGQHSPQLAELLFTHAMCAQAIDHYHRRQLWRRERRLATSFRAPANTTLLSGAGPLSSIQAAHAGGRMRGTGGAWPRGRAQTLRWRHAKGETSSALEHPNQFRKIPRPSTLVRRMHISARSRTTQPSSG